MSFIDLREIMTQADRGLRRAALKAECEIWERPEFGDVKLYQPSTIEISVNLPLVPAAVLIAAIPKGDDWDIILTKRSENLRKHSGQVSFPGGKTDPEDSSQMAAAIREAKEEISLEPQYIEVIGALEDYETVTGFAITPVVAIVKEGFVLEPDIREVDEIFTVSLANILQEGSYRIESRIFKGKERHFYVFPHSKHKIWGATAAILVHFCKLIKAHR